ncbi:MAG: FKBP-type peptidyl-prolyl cis-trans isomerase [Bacteroidetes bacterium]|nr:FKBP-type peptidyl-prolyl cis-trans isomerase [Bacteroidota bacterium]
MTKPLLNPPRWGGLLINVLHSPSLTGRVGVGLLFFLFFSCSDSPFPDFTKTKNGLYYKLIDIGESDKRAKPGDYVTVQMIIKSEKDSILYDTRRIGLDGSVTFLLTTPQQEKDYREGFQYLSEGDSAAFITDAYAFYMKKNNKPVPMGMKMESIIKVQARVLKIRTPEEHAKDMLIEKGKLEQAEFEEKKILDKYMADSSIPAQLIGNGMYYIKLQEGKGLTPDSGSVALLNYRGSFLNGRCFDFFFESQPFEYMVGQEDQLIKGLEIGVRRMHEGEKAKFIIPSHLAFGSSGSSTEIVPPFTTVIYEVELLKVQ